ncbi:MAG: hypothetical protein V7719_07175 [Psychroserpens sp.]|uniref:hypothetical protein n=1 Tax=Psychroserpens sp. TaxID=2020870 RepID=UPI003002727E
MNSSVTNPFCDSCNRLRLTANEQLKNCLFSSTKSDLLTTLRSGKPIEPKLHNNNNNNRSMITTAG